MALTIVLLAALLLAACGGQPTDVKLNTKASLDGRLLTIEGTATVPDGSYIAYDVEVPAPGCDTCHQHGSIQVHNGAFTKTLDLSDFQPGELEVWTAFQMILDAEQPQEALELYGERGELMTGRDVVEYGNHYRVEQVTHLQLD